VIEPDRLDHVDDAIPAEGPAAARR
jgi:hypothetical protein